MTPRSPGTCNCEQSDHGAQYIVLTGGPGAGKTAILELARRYFCPHVTVLPEAASIVFSGGFIRRESLPAKKAAQRAIFHVENELETLVREEGQSAIVLCDRGTLDALAYWPNSEESFWREVRTTRDKELARYSAVIHLRTPSVSNGYNHTNPMRVETVQEAQAIDQRIVKAWEGHPKRFFVEASEEFFDKARKTIDLIAAEIPKCCRAGVLKN